VFSWEETKFRILELWLPREEMPVMVINQPRRCSITAAIAIVAVLSTCTVAAAQQRAFRLSSISLLEPHVFPVQLNCIDGTGFVNPLINGEITACDKLDPNQPNAEPCELSLNLVAIFDPLVQAPDTGGILNFAVFPSCIRNGGVVDCAEAPSQTVPTTYSNEGTGVPCLGAIPGTVGPRNVGNYSPPVATTTGPCLVTDILNLEFNLGDINIPLMGAQLAAQYSGDPATGLINGLARGFLSEATAAAIVLNFPPLLTNVQFSSLFKGGAGSTCTGDDRDFNPPDDMNGERGWWFYLAFTADPVEAPEIVVPTPTATSPQNTPTPTLPAPTATPTSPSSVMCPGDCNGDDQVPIEEVQTAAGIFLSALPLSACPAADADTSGQVFIFELQRVVNSFRLGCP
jgi:hypothetical protein